MKGQESKSEQGKEHSLDIRKRKASKGIKENQRDGDPSVRKDYHVYELNIREKAVYLVGYILAASLVSFLFYHSLFPAVIAIPFAGKFLKGQQKRLAEKQRKQFLAEFLTGIRAVSNALGAGYSIENAFEQAEKETRKVYGENSMIVREFSYLTSMLKVNRTLEYLLEELGQRSGLEDVESFAEVFAVARRSGGDLNLIIRSTVEHISQKEETRQEIETGISSRKMEQKVMSVIPMFILFYVGTASPELLEGMYGNVLGIAVMSGCLLVYGAAFRWGSRIVKIEV